MFKIRWLLAFIGLLLPTLALSEDHTLGLYVGVGTFKYDVKGEIGAGAEPVELGTDLNLGDEQKTLYYLDFDHNFPLLPKFRLESMDVDVNGTAELLRDISFNGTNFTPPAALQSRFEWTQLNAALYYTLVDIADLQLDLGISLRQIEGEVEIVSSLSQTNIDFDETLPLLYSKFRFDMYSGWWIGAELHGAAFSDNQILDTNIKLGWETEYGLGLEVGYRELQIELEDLGDITESDVELSGPYFGLNFRI